MPTDADRFRPPERRAMDHDVLERGSAGQQPSQDGARDASAQSAPQSVPRYAPPQSAPRYAQPQTLVPPGFAPPKQLPSPYAATHYPAAPGASAPLIHPAAAQASSLTPYGVPVYRTPIYALAPQPSRGLSITALVLGGASLLFAWVFVVVPIIGIVFGFIALNREPTGRALSIVGLVCSGLSLLLVLLVYLLPLLLFLGAAFTI